MSTVLVTGGSGFIGGHCILQLLAGGHEVRTTIRSLKRKSDVLASLQQAGVEPDGRLAFFVAHLESDAGWAEAISGCDYVLHVATPILLNPKHEDEVIVPAREGTLRVLRLARDAGVKRVVVTSSFAAIGYGHEPPPPHAPFNETIWADPDGEDGIPYTKSKTMAERAAWDFIAREGGKLELAAINPVNVLGPVLGPNYANSIEVIKRLMDGALPGCPRIYYNIVDVRDVADLHLRAMTHPAAEGQRFLAMGGEPMLMVEIARVLKGSLGASAKKVPARQAPDWLVRVVATRNPEARQVIYRLGRIMNASSEKAKRILGWVPRSNQETIAATGESLVRLGLLKHSPRKAA